MCGCFVDRSTFVYFNGLAANKLIVEISILFFSVSGLFNSIFNKTYRNINFILTSNQVISLVIWVH